MKKRYTREKKTLCGEGYMEVDLYHITPEEHAAKRRKKTRPSSERQKKRNAQHAHRWRVQKANANFTVLGFYLTLTYIEAFLPESMEQAQRDLRNYIRRVKAAIAKLYGADVELDAQLERYGERVMSDKNAAAMATVLMTVAEKAAAMVPSQSQSEGDAPPLVEIGAEGREEKGPEVMVDGA